MPALLLHTAPHRVSDALSSKPLPVAPAPPDFPLPLDQSDVRYIHGPDSTVQKGAPAGTVTEFSWNDSTVHRGTSPKCWVRLTYTYGSNNQPSDTTSWEASLEGDPVRLVE